MRQVLTWGRRPRRKTNGKHKVNTVQRVSEVQSVCQPPRAHPPDSLPWANPALPRLTSGHVSGTEEEGGREEREAIQGDWWEGLSCAQGVQQPDEETADAEVDRPAVCNHPVVALGNGPVRNWASPLTTLLVCAHSQHTPDLATSKLENWGSWEQSGDQGTLPLSRHGLASGLRPSKGLLARALPHRYSHAWEMLRQAAHSGRETRLCWQQELVPTEERKH